MANKQSVKEQILTKLKKEKKLTVAELACSFHITDIALRRHIQKLEREGFVFSNVEKQPLGRPYYVYALTEKGHGYFPSKYEQFSKEILVQVEELKGRPFVYQLLNAWLEQGKEDYHQIHNHQELSEQVNQLAAIQEEKGYMTEVNGNEDGSFELKQFNCPIWSIANQYQDCCNQEEALFDSIFPDSNVSLTSCIISGSNCCNFLIRKY